MKPRFLPVAIALLLASPALLAEAVKDREGAVRKDREERENDPRWIYNDLDRGFAEAKATGKPLMVVLRCVPCLACSGIDAQVLLENTELSPLMDRFVRVRLINANAIDLARFQFDYDLSFTTLFFNADGTVYGRFGSWSHQKNSQDRTTDSFRRALEATLEIHRGYPANRDSLAGKQGAPSPYRTPVDIPGLQGKYTRFLNWNGKVVPSCVHCHQVNDALRITRRAAKETLPLDLIYPHPAPETLGLTLSPAHIARVEAVAPGSPAAAAGLQPGDDLVQVAGQPLISPADLSWALHRHPDSGPLEARLRRGNSDRTVRIDLPAGWRARSDISRRVGTWGMRAMAAGGLQLEDVPDAERSRLGLAADTLALRVRHAGEYGEHAAAKKAGFRKDDILVAVEGSRARQTESAFIGSILTRHVPGTRLPVEVLRGAERLELQLPVQ